MHLVAHGQAAASFTSAACAVQALHSPFLIQSAFPGPQTHMSSPAKGLLLQTWHWFSELMHLVAHEQASVTFTSAAQALHSPSLIQSAFPGPQTHLSSPANGLLVQSWHWFSELMHLVAHEQASVTFTSAAQALHSPSLIQSACPGPQTHLSSPANGLLVQSWHW